MEGNVSGSDHIKWPRLNAISETVMMINIFAMDNDRGEWFELVENKKQVAQRSNQMATGQRSSPNDMSAFSNVRHFYNHFLCSPSLSFSSIKNIRRMAEISVESTPQFSWKSQMKFKGTPPGPISFINACKWSWVVGTPLWNTCVSFCSPARGLALQYPSQVA